MYKITATVIKAGGTPTQWTRHSVKKLSKTECEKMLSGRTSAPACLPANERVTLQDFKCEREVSQ